jgi:hypothetical protein
VLRAIFASCESANIVHVTLSPFTAFTLFAWMCNFPSAFARVAFCADPTCQLVLALLTDVLHAALDSAVLDAHRPRGRVTLQNRFIVITEPTVTNHALLYTFDISAIESCVTRVLVVAAQFPGLEVAMCRLAPSSGISFAARIRRLKVARFGCIAQSACNTGRFVIA